MAPCFVRRLDHWYTATAQAKEPVDCANCGKSIPRGMWTVFQKLYVWPDLALGTQPSQPIDSGAGTGVVVGGNSTAEAAKQANSGVWHNLSAKTQGRFLSGGLSGRGMGRLTPAMARRLYEKEIPLAIRNQGEKAVQEFIKGKHLSHLKPVVKYPGLAKRPSNIVIEDAGKKLSRRSLNMTGSDFTAAKSASAGRHSTIRATAQSAAKGAGIAAALEAPVSGLENFFHYRNSRKSGGQAAKDTAKSTATAGVVGLAATGAVKGAALIGVSPTLGPAGIPLAVAGGALIIGSGAYRIIKAARRDLPLDEYRLFFCKDTDCKTKFARAVTFDTRQA